MRVVWAASGCIALGLGMFGIALPLLPTVPFLLLAAFCFARSSNRLHEWLINHSVFGPPIKDWQRSGAISLKAKRLATLSIVAAFCLSVLLGVPSTILILQVVVLTAVTIFIWSRPSH